MLQCGSLQSLVLCTPFGYATGLEHLPREKKAKSFGAIISFKHGCLALFLPVREAVKVANGALLKSIKSAKKRDC